MYLAENMDKSYSVDLDSDSCFQDIVARISAGKLGFSGFVRNIVVCTLRYMHGLFVQVARGSPKLYSVVSVRLCASVFNKDSSRPKECRN